MSRFRNRQQQLRGGELKRHLFLSPKDPRASREDRVFARSSGSNKFRSAARRRSYGRGRGGKKQEDGRNEAYRRGLEAAQKFSVDGGKYVWTFGFGANINPWKLQERRGIIPVASSPAFLPNYRLVFNHRGGFGNIVHTPSYPNVHNGSGENKALSPKAVHGVVLKVKLVDFAKLAAMEHQYRPEQIVVHTYSPVKKSTKHQKGGEAREEVDKVSKEEPDSPLSTSKSIAALAFVSIPEYCTKQKDLQPTMRYLNLIRNGARSMGLESRYCDWLEKGLTGLPENQKRGQDYYDTVQASNVTNEKGGKGDVQRETNTTTSSK